MINPELMSSEHLNTYTSSSCSAASEHIHTNASSTCSCNAKHSNVSCRAAQQGVGCGGNHAQPCKVLPSLLAQ